MHRTLIPFATMLALVSFPASAQVCTNGNIPTGADGRTLGHLPYGDTAETDLVPVPAGLAVGACRLRPEMLPDLERLLAAAAHDPAVGGRILALSCHRSLAYQQSVFCRERQTDASDRAMSVAPPGHSEHATGFALDFAFRPRVNGCPDAEACIAATPAFRWLVANAPRYGFEMSFPAGNRQRVKWEPWHWRWVGASEATPGAMRARALFGRARREFPASPAVAPAPVTITAVPQPPVWLPSVPVADCRSGRCRAPRR